MAEVNLLTEEIMAFIGREMPQRVSLPVTAQEIRKYCEATGDMNPLFVDEEYAKKGPYGGIIAPPTYYQVTLDWLVPGSFAPVATGVDTDQEIAALKAWFGLRRALDATQSMEFFVPIRPGDVLTAREHIADIRQKKLRIGPALICALERKCTNQKGELVCLERREFFFY